MPEVSPAGGYFRLMQDPQLRHGARNRAPAYNRREKFVRARSSGSSVRSRSLETKSPATNSAKRCRARPVEGPQNRRAGVSIPEDVQTLRKEMFLRDAELCAQSSSPSARGVQAAPANEGFHGSSRARSVSLSPHRSRGIVNNHRYRRSATRVSIGYWKYCGSLAERARPRHSSPRQIFAPGPVVVHEFRNVFLLRQTSQEEVLQNCVVDHRNSRLFERALVDLPVQVIVAQMIKIDIAIRPASTAPRD